MAYSKGFTPEYENGWKDKPDTSTPVVAEALNAYDTAIQNIETFLDGAFFSTSTITKTVSEITSGSVEYFTLNSGEARDIGINFYGDIPEGKGIFSILTVTLLDSSLIGDVERPCSYCIKSIIPRYAPNVTIRVVNDTGDSYDFSKVKCDVMFCKTDLF